MSTVKKLLYAEDLNDPKTIREVTVIKETDDLYITNIGHLYKVYTFPLEFRDKLLDVLTVRAELKAKYDDSIKLIYALRNEVKNQIKV